MATVALGILAPFVLDKLYDHFFGKGLVGKGKGKTKSKSVSRQAKILAVSKKLAKMPQHKQIALIKSKT